MRKASRWAITCQASGIMKEGYHINNQNHTRRWDKSSNVLLAIFHIQMRQKNAILLPQSKKISGSRLRVAVHQKKVKILTLQTQFRCKYEPLSAVCFFQLLKHERIRRRTYLTRNTARSDLFDYIQMF